MTKRKKKFISQVVSLQRPASCVALCLAALLLVSCAAKAPIGKIELHPSLSVKVKKTKTFEGTKTEETEGKYSRLGEELLFENNDITVVVKEAKEHLYVKGSAVFKILKERQFILLGMSITNRSEKQKVRYEPAITALMDSSLGYLKPLDYPRLYELGMSDKALDKGLTDFRSSFYDLGITVQPLQTVYRYIIFTPISKSAKRAKLIIKNLYTGTETIDLVFPFTISKSAKVKE